MRYAAQTTVHAGLCLATYSMLSYTVHSQMQDQYQNRFVLIKEHIILLEMLPLSLKGMILLLK